MSRTAESRPQTPRPGADGPRRRRRRPWLVALVVLLVALLAVGVAVAVYVGGLARSIDEGTQRFEGGAFPAESLRPSEPGRRGGGEDEPAGQGGPGQGGGEPAAAPLAPTAPPPGMDPAVVEAQADAAVQGPVAPDEDEAVDGQALDVLLVGEDAGAEGRGDDGRSDTLMWVHVPGDRSEVQVMSIMRDMWVPIPGHGDAKVNAAYQYGGIPLTVATAENMFQARVDHVVAVDLAGFKGLVDALGGVTVDNPRAFTSTGGVDFPAGAVHMDGDTALAYARERYNLPRSDFDRVENQQRLVKAIVDRFLSRDTLSDPARVQDSVARFAPFLTLDDSLDSGRLASLAWSLRDARDAPIRTSTVPSVGVGNTEGGQDVVWPDWAAIGRLGEGIRTGTLEEAVAP
ncbi:LCP family protein [Micrococcus endophyticus]|uniref:LCP family protein required for cell wall assembly n=1 Tax=Micrococcus endophyticus TaxID=455343 RepID=A0A7W9JI97_9MICC|nr:LCP family protein required for cell wall assembly [Micrococcus endophyticus]